MEKYLLHVLCYSALMYSSLVCSCLFSIIYLTLMFWGGLEPIPADIQREAGSALHRSPVHRKADVQTTITLTFTPTSSLESPINPRVFGLWKEAGALAGSPHRHGENMLKSVFIKLFSALFVLYLLISAAVALSVRLCVCVCVCGGVFVSDTVRDMREVDIVLLAVAATRRGVNHAYFASICCDCIMCFFIFFPLIIL